MLPFQSRLSRVYRLLALAESKHRLERAGAVGCQAELNRRCD
jgi:hypothetical protein